MKKKKITKHEQYKLFLRIYKKTLKEVQRKKLTVAKNICWHNGVALGICNLADDFEYKFDAFGRTTIKLVHTLFKPWITTGYYMRKPNQSYTTKELKESLQKRIDFLTLLVNKTKPKI